MFVKKGKNKTDFLNEDDENEIFIAFEDSIIADLTNKVFNLESNNLNE